MAIDNRQDVVPGTTLVATYKGERYSALVIETEEGVRFQLSSDGSRHKSPSAAASAIMNGASVNGWRFWSIDGQEPVRKPRKTAEEKAAERKAKAKAKPRKTVSKNIKKLRGKSDDGQVRWFCSACQKGFEVPIEDGEPEQCPEGHPKPMQDDFEDTEVVAETSEDAPEAAAEDDEEIDLFD